MKTFRPNVDRVVGHNIYDFDLKFILKRSIIHGVRPTVDRSFARYRKRPIFDTMYEWERCSDNACAGSRIQQSDLFAWKAEDSQQECKFDDRD